MSALSKAMLAMLVAPFVINCSGGAGFSPRPLPLDDGSAGGSLDTGAGGGDGTSSGGSGSGGSGSGDGGSGGGSTGGGGTGGGGTGGGGGGTINPGSGFEMKTKTIQVKANGDVDILFVVDNSGSMSQEQAELANRINGFMDIVKDLNWRVALTTTDNRSSFAWGDGQFRPMDGNKFFLTSQEYSAAQAQALLAAAINVGTSGSGDERGVNATYRAIERIKSSSYHANFFRPQASLAVVLISDEDECSNGGCLSSSIKSNPQALADLVDDVFGMEKKFNFHSIIKVPGDNACTAAASFGNTYAAMTQLVGGVMASICSPNYTNLLTDIGNKVVELVESTTLSCAPADINKDGKPDVIVALQGGNMLLTSDFRLQGTTITFNQALPEGTHSVTYYCAIAGGGGQL